MRLWTLIVLLLIATLSFAEEKYKFQWKSAKASIKETYTVNGNPTIIANYQIETFDEIDGIVVHQSELNVVSVNGVKPYGPLKKRYETNFLMPDLKVDHKGQPIEIVNIEDFLKKHAESNYNWHYSQAIENIDELREGLLNASLAKWSYWVSSWVEVDFTNTEPIEEDYYQDVSRFIEFPQKIVTSVLPSPEKTDTYQVNMRIIVDSDEATQAFVDFVDRTQQRHNPYSIYKVDRSSKHAFKKMVVIDGALEQSTHRPITINVKDQTLTMINKKSNDEEFVRSYEFEWVQ